MITPGPDACYHEQISRASSKEWKRIHASTHRIKFPEEWEERLPGYFEKLIWPCVHADHRHPTTVFYYRNMSELLAGKFSQLRVGKFIIQEWGEIPEFEELVAVWRANANLPEVHFAKTADEIERVFITGPHSCMVGKFSTITHPTRVYAAGDLEVAYITRGGRVRARCVCWPEKKVMNTCYGDSTVLKKALKDLGYTYSQSGFVGARISKEAEDKWWLMPFIDGHKFVTMYDDHFKIGLHEDGELFSPSTERGYALLGTKCDGCGDRFAEPGIPPTKDGLKLCRGCYRECTWECSCCRNRMYRRSWSSTPIKQNFILDRVFYTNVCSECFDKYEGRILPHQDKEHFTIYYGSSTMSEKDAKRFAKEEGLING